MASEPEADQGHDGADGPGDLVAFADRLYGLPLVEFTPTRDARVKDLRKSDRMLADAVKSLRKPSLAAWVINLLVRRESEQVDQVIQVGEALRDAQANLEGEQLRELTRQRRQLTAAVTTQARRLAGAEGVKITQAVADQIEGSLTAAMVSGDAATALRSGLLVTAMTTTGIDDLDVAVHLALPEALGFAASVQLPGEVSQGQPGQSAGRPNLRVVPDPDAEVKQLAAAHEDLAEAQALVDEAAADLAHAQEAVSAHEASSLHVQAEIEDLQRRLADLEERQVGIDADLAEAHESVEFAHNELTRADSERARLAKRVSQLSDRTMSNTR